MTKFLTKQDLKAAIDKAWSAGVESTYGDPLRVAVLAEREACAQLCEDSVEYAGSELARQIRARNDLS